MRHSILLVLLLFFLLFPKTCFAITDPIATPNNKVGIHIFDPSEINSVSDLVNSNGGEWGYVTVPLRSDDRDREKWNAFMHTCKEKKLIPIVRLATTMSPNYWTKPGYYDGIDFANFLNDLDWPIQNRYVIIYNEPNHATEWGGEVNPGEYASVLERTAKIFKERNTDFYILPAGLDAAAPNSSGYMNWKTFLQTMNYSNPDALLFIDGWNSHSYPNPAFSSSPYAKHDHSIISFSYERDYVKRLTGKKLSVFITETGWSDENLNDTTIANYYQQAFTSVWNDSNIVTVTPFVLSANAGPFQVFSLLNPDNSCKPQYDTIKNLYKIKGEPILNGDKQSINTVLPVLGEQSEASSSSVSTSVSAQKPLKSVYDMLDLKQIISFIKWF